MDELAAYRAAAARLDALIDPVGPADHSLPAIWARAAAKLERARAFLAYLGNPQDTFPIVHVTGTSGKGSTCAAIASILSAAGYHAGLATSPYLQVATEKLQLGDDLIAVDAFASLVDELLAAADSWQRRARLDRPLTYGEVWMALTATWFARERAEIAVIEVGAGGRFDVSNLVRPIVTVVTSVGLDHTATLGPTIDHIAWHKAGIFKTGAAAVTAATDPAALAVLRQEAGALGTPLTEIDPERSLTIVGGDQDRPGIDWQLVDGDGRPQSRVYHSRQPGRYQAVNGTVALAVAHRLEDRGFQIPESAIAKGLASARMPGRSEWMPTSSGPAVLLDAAHNPDKIGALVASLPRLIESRTGGGALPVLLAGALSGKDAPAMIEQLGASVSAVVTTSAGVTGKLPLPADAMARVVGDSGFPGPVIAEGDPQGALTLAMELARERGVPVLVTGSLYLVGRVRGRWYRDDDILRQRTPWPASNR